MDLSRPLRQQAELVGELREQSVGALHLKVYCHINLGLAHYRLGDYEESEHLLTKSLDQFAKLDDLFGQGSGSLYLGLTLEKTCNIIAAENSY